MSLAWAMQATWHSEKNCRMKKTAVLFLAILALLALSCREHYPYPKISGHRGANFIAPENTLASADSCIRSGV